MGTNRQLDAYGLPCGVSELLDTYQPIWRDVDSVQTDRWGVFLQQAAVSLQLQAGVVCLEDPSRSHAAVEWILQQLLTQGERHAPHELWRELVALVHGGVPACIRLVTWPAFLRPAETTAQALATDAAADMTHQQPQQPQQPQQQWWGAAHYKALCALQQRLFEAVAAAKATPPSAHHNAQQGSVPAVPDAPAAAAADGGGYAPAAAEAAEEAGSRGASAPAAAAAVSASGSAAEQLAAAVAASGLPISPQQLLEWQLGCKVWDSQISKDVHRTFPGHQWLSSPAGQRSLTRLLSCFCLAAPHLGYCQGMNYVAGSMLLLLGPGITCQQQQQESGSGRTSNTRAGGQQPTSAPSTDSTALPAPTCNGNNSSGSDANSGSCNNSSSNNSGSSSTCPGSVLTLEQLEAVVFECLMGFATRVLQGYYSPAMLAPQIDQRVLAHLATEHLPALTQRLTSLGLDPSQPCPAWLLSGFTASNMPLSTVARLWDVAFFEQSGAAFIRACLALLHLFSAAFDAALDACDAVLLLQALPGLAYDADRLLSLSSSAYGEVDPTALLALQHCFRAEVLLETERAAALTRKQQQQQQQRHQQPCVQQAVAGSKEAAVKAAAVATAATAAADADACEAPAAARAGGGDADADAARADSPGWVPDFETAAPAPQPAAVPAAAGGGSATEQQRPQPQQQQQPQPQQQRRWQRRKQLHAGHQYQAGPGQRGQVDGGEGRGEGADREEEEDEESGEMGSLLGNQQQQQQQQQNQHQQPRFLRSSSSSSSSSRLQAAAGIGGGTSEVAGGRSGSAVLKTHSVEVSSSKAIAQAIAIAAAPGMPASLSCASNSASQAQQQQQHQRQQRQQQQAHTDTSANTSNSGGSSSRRAQLAAGYPVGSVPAAHQAFSPGSLPHRGNNSRASSTSKVCSPQAYLEDSGELFEEIEGSGWMLLCGKDSPPPDGAAAAGSNGSPQAAAHSVAQDATAAAQQRDIDVMCENLRDKYGLPDLSAALQHLAAAVRAATPAAADANGALPPGTAAAEAEATAAAEATATAPGSSSHTDSSGGTGVDSSEGLPLRCLSLARSALAAAEQLTRDMAQQACGVAALECQLERSKCRLEQQDAELALRDETIEQLQQQPLQGSGLNARHAQVPAAAAAAAAAKAGRIVTSSTRISSSSGNGGAMARGSKKG